MVGDKAGLQVTARRPGRVVRCGFWSFAWDLDHREHVEHVWGREFNLASQFDWDDSVRLCYR